MAGEGESKAHEIRMLASPDGVSHSTWLGLAFAAVDYVVFYVGAALFIVAPWWPVKAAGVIVSGVAAATLFVLGHDAAHGSLARSRRVNRVIATVCFLPSWWPYTPWVRGHNHLHHSWTNVAEVDYAWCPVSPTVYRAMPGWRRAIERAYRSWWGLWIYSIVEIWWKHNAMPRASDRRYLDNRHLAADRAAVAAGVASHVAVCCWLAPAWSTSAGGPALSPPVIIAALVVAPWWIFHVLFSALTFQHHTHPAVHWVRTKRESSYFAGQVRATVHIELPRWAELWLHHITDHNAHHVDPRIGFRSLPSAQRRIEEAFAEHVIIERWSLGSLIKVTRSCQLYDYEAREWRGFASV